MSEPSVGNRVKLQKGGRGMNIAAIAKALDRSIYPVRVSKEVVEIAKEKGIVIVFGASDDLMEFRGAIDDEVGCYDGGSALIDEKGLLPCRESIDDDDELEEFFARKKSAVKIDAVWCEGGYSWIYRAPFPHATFEAIDDDDLYCRGIVFDLSEIRSKL